MPTKKTSAKVLEAKGTFRKNPQRKREDLEVSTPLGNPPDSFTDDQREAWQEVVTRARQGLLTGADWQLVVMASLLFAELVRDPDSMNAAKISRLHSALGDLGMTPQSRMGMAPPAAKEENPFAWLDRDNPHPSKRIHPSPGDK